MTGSRGRRLMKVLTDAVVDFYSDLDLLTSPLQLHLAQYFQSYHRLSRPRTLIMPGGPTINDKVSMDASCVVDTGDTADCEAKEADRFL
jgi:hypothetical protein